MERLLCYPITQNLDIFCTCTNSVIHAGPVLTPDHAKWLVDVYNYYSTPGGRELIFKGWKKAGVRVIFDGSKVVPPENPYATIYYMKIECIVLSSISSFYPK